jgi:hypothetical protein
MSGSNAKRPFGGTRVSQEGPEAVILEPQGSRRSFQGTGAKRKANPEAVPRLGAAFEARTRGHLRTTVERTLKLRRLDPWTKVSVSECPTGVDASPPSTQPCFTIGHSLLLRGRAASSAGTVASSLR